MALSKMLADFIYTTRFRRSRLKSVLEPDLDDYMPKIVPSNPKDLSINDIIIAERSTAKMYTVEEVEVFLDNLKEAAMEIAENAYDYASHESLLPRGCDGTGYYNADRPFEKRWCAPKDPVAIADLIHRIEVGSFVK